MLIQANEWLRNVGLLWCGLGALQLTIALAKSAPLSGTGFWALLGLICLAIYRVRRVRYTVFRTPEGNVLVIQGKSHDELVSQFAERRRNQLRDWYGEVNLENDPEREVAKFKWLEKQKALSPGETAQRISRIKSSRGEQSDNDAAEPN